MPAELPLSLGTLFGFLLVFARVAGAVSFVPLPGIRSGPEPARVVLAAGFTVALFPRWPEVNAAAATPLTVIGWVLAEAASGITMGVAVAIVLEAFVVAAQVLGLQAGYAYASTIDPSTEADSGVLLVFAQLVSGLLFFALGLDREVLRLLAYSLERVPAGAWHFTPDAAEVLVRAAALLFSVGLRLALPVVALLVMVDVALALLGRLNAQLQLLSLAFPAKMLTALALLAAIAGVLPRLMTETAGHAFRAARALMGT